MTPRRRWTLQWHPLRGIKRRWADDPDGFMVTSFMSMLVVAGVTVFSTLTEVSHPFWTTTRVVAFSAGMALPALWVLGLALLALWGLVTLLVEHPPVRRVVRDEDRERYEEALRRVREYEEGRI